MCEHSIHPIVFAFDTSAVLSFRRNFLSFNFKWKTLTPCNAIVPRTHRGARKRQSSETSRTSCTQHFILLNHLHVSGSYIIAMKNLPELEVSLWSFVDPHNFVAIFLTVEESQCLRDGPRLVIILLTERGHLKQNFLNCLYILSVSLLSVKLLHRCLATLTVTVCFVVHFASVLWIEALVFNCWGNEINFKSAWSCVFTYSLEWSQYFKSSLTVPYWYEYKNVNAHLKTWKFDD